VATRFQLLTLSERPTLEEVYSRMSKISITLTSTELVGQTSALVATPSHGRDAPIT
jgi:hypothetical protein